MSKNRHIIKLATAYPGLQEEKGSKNPTFRGEVGVEDNTKRNAYIKKLNVSQKCREVLISVVGRMLALPILEPFYVDVAPSYMGLPEGNSQHIIAFAVEAEQVPAQRILHDDVLRVMGKWNELYRCAAFDALIGNRDRLPKNLLFAGNGAYWLIDHEEALPAHMSIDDAIGVQLCSFIRETHTNEVDLYRARDRMMSFINTVNNIDWDDVVEALRLREIVEMQHECDRLIKFIQGRIPHMQDILSKELHLKQQEFPFSTMITTGKEGKA